MGTRVNGLVRRWVSGSGNEWRFLLLKHSNVGILDFNLEMLSTSLKIEPQCLSYSNVVLPVDCTSTNAVKYVYRTYVLLSKLMFQCCIMFPIPAI